jgi:hypothetical protein
VKIAGSYKKTPFLRERQGQFLASRKKTSQHHSDQIIFIDEKPCFMAKTGCSPKEATTLN